MYDYQLAYHKGILMRYIIIMVLCSLPLTVFALGSNSNADLELDSFHEDNGEEILP